MVACTALAAYSSLSARLHSLPGVDADGVTVSVPAQAPVRTYLVDVVAVRAPPSVTGRRLVAQAGSGQVDVLEMDRWVPPVADEIRAALSPGLALQIRAMDLYGLLYDGRRPAYRVVVGVQWFDAWRGLYVLIDTVWMMRTADDRQLLMCHSIVQKSVSAGIDGAVEGHQCALEALAPQTVQVPLAYAVAPVEVAWPILGCLDLATSTVGK